MLKVLLFLGFLAVAFQHQITEPYLNEIFLQPLPTESENEEYIELKVPTAFTLNNDILKYAICIIDKSDIINYFVLSGMVRNVVDQVDDVHLIVVSNSDRTPNLQYLQEGFVLRTKSEVAMLLLKNPTEDDLRLLHLRQRGNNYKLLSPAPLSNENRAVLRKLAVDFVLYRSKHFDTDGIHTNWLSSIFPLFPGDVNVLPVGNDRTYDEVSLSRCVRNGLLVFEYDTPSPGTTNLCQKLTMTHEAERVPHGLTNLENNFNTRTASQTPSQGNNEDLQIGQPNTWIETHSEQLLKNGMLSKEAEKFFQSHPHRRLYRLLVDTQDIKKSAIRCEICYETSQNPDATHPFGKKASQIPSIIQEKGQQFLNVPSETWRRVNNHEKDKYHENCVKNFGRQTSVSPVADVYEEIPPDETLHVTADKISLVYLETKIGMSFRAHEVLAEGLYQLGFTTGTELNGRKTAARIVKFLGEKIHQNLIARLISSDSEFSIMLDSSTDIGSVHTMLVYIRYIEDNMPITKVFQLTESHDSSADGMWGEIESSFNNEGTTFTSYVKRKCIALGTDGASNMIGKYNSLKTKMRNYVSVGERATHQFQHYHCANHKLALAYNDVVYSSHPDLVFCKTLIAHCNLLANFYGTKSYKRRDELLTHSTLLNEEIRAFTRIQKVRWVPATQTSYQSILQNYRTFMSHLDTMVNAENYRAYTHEQRLNAHTIFELFSDKHLISTLHMHLDIIQELSKWARWLERRNSQVIDLHEWHKSAKNAFEVMKVADGDNLQNLLKTSTCDHQVCESVDVFEDALNVTWKGMQLSESENAQIPALSNTRQDVLDALLSSFENRFPEEAVSAFSVLNPPFISSSTNEQWTALGNYMQMYHGTSTSLERQLLEFKNHLITTEFYNQNKNDPPEIFWPNALSESTLQWSEDLKLVIRIALVQPVSTAQVEAGFSILTGIKTDYRSKLQTPLMQHILRLKFNGPVVKYLPKYRLARDWINAGHERADSTKRPRKDKITRSEYIKSKRF